MIIYCTGSGLGVTCGTFYTKITMHHVFLNKLPGNDNDNDNDNVCGITYPIINFRHPTPPSLLPRPTSCCTSDNRLKWNIDHLS